MFVDSREKKTFIKLEFDTMSFCLVSNYEIFYIFCAVIFKSCKLHMEEIKKFPLNRHTSALKRPISARSRTQSSEIHSSGKKNGITRSQSVSSLRVQNSDEISDEKIQYEIVCLFFTKKPKFYIKFFFL
jgi:hypothetical protein